MKLYMHVLLEEVLLRDCSFFEVSATEKPYNTYHSNPVS